MKRKYIRNETRLRQTQGCLTDCVAYYFNVHQENVPFFVYPRCDWMKRVRAFFRKFGYKCYWIKNTNIPKGRGLHIVCGNSLEWKTASHVVVYKNGKLAYDPQYPSKWNDKRITHHLIVYK
jgi:hypothetical protein